MQELFMNRCVRGTDPIQKNTMPTLPPHDFPHPEVGELMNLKGIYNVTDLDCL